MSESDLRRVVDQFTDARTGRVEYASLLTVQSERRPIRDGSYAAQYAEEKRKQSNRAADVEKRLCATMDNPASIATLRRKLQAADASDVGTLAPNDFARALRDYTGEPLDDEDEIALCEAYDHRVPARLLEDDAMKAPAAMTGADEKKTERDEGADFVVPLASPRKAQLRREEDEGVRAFVDRRLFVNRRGCGSRSVAKSRSDEAMRAILWRGDTDEAVVRWRLDEKETEQNAMDEQRPVGFRPVLGRSHREPNWDAVDYRRFLESLESRADESTWSNARRRTVRKIADALSTDDARDRWARNFSENQQKLPKPSDAVAAFASLGINLSRRELLEALELGSVSNNGTTRFDSRRLASRALADVETLDSADNARREAIVDQARDKAKNRRRSSRAAIEGARSSGVFYERSRAAVGTERKGGSGYFYLAANEKPVVLRSEVDRDRPSTVVDTADMPPAAGSRSVPGKDAPRRPTQTYATDEEPLGKSSTRFERRERLSLERATTSIALRASRSRLAAALEALPSDRVDADTLQRTLRGAGAPVGSRDAARIIAEAASGDSPSRRQVSDLLLARVDVDNDDAVGKVRALKPREDTSRDFLVLVDEEVRHAKQKLTANDKTSSDARTADNAVSLGIIAPFARSRRRSERIWTGMPTPRIRRLPPPKTFAAGTVRNRNRDAAVSEIGRICP